MPRRFFLVPIIGEGTEDNPYRPPVADMAEYMDWSCQIENDPVTGVPLQSKCVVGVDSDDFSALEAAGYPDVTAV